MLQRHLTELITDHDNIAQLCTIIMRLESLLNLIPEALHAGLCFIKTPVHIITRHFWPF